MDPDLAGQYFFSLLVIIGFYIFIHSGIEGIKKKYSWRWAIIVFMAAYAFYVFGNNTGTFEFMIEKFKEFSSSSETTP